MRSPLTFFSSFSVSECHHASLGAIELLPEILRVVAPPSPSSELLQAVQDKVSPNELLVEVVRDVGAMPAPLQHVVELLKDIDLVEFHVSCSAIVSLGEKVCYVGIAPFFSKLYPRVAHKTKAFFL